MWTAFVKIIFFSNHLFTPAKIYLVLFLSLIWTFIERPWLETFFWYSRLTACRPKVFTCCLPFLGKLVTLGVILSTLSSTNSSLYSNSRFAEVCAKRGDIPKIFSFVTPSYGTPALSCILIGSLGLLYIIPEASNFASLINLFSLISWIFYGLGAWCVLILRFKKPYVEKTRPYKVNILFLLISTIGSVYLVFAPIINDPAIEWFYPIIITLAGLLPYFLFFRNDKIYLPWFQVHLQNTMQVFPFNPDK